MSAVEDASFYREILDTFSGHIAVIRRDGEIVYVNQAWQAFARDNGDPELRYTGVGQNYLAVCQRALMSNQAEEVVAGLSAVLSGRRGFYEIEYPCHGLARERWFLMQATPLVGDPDRGLLIVHTNITARKLAKERDEAARAEVALQEQREREMHALEGLHLSPGGAGAGEVGLSAAVRQEVVVEYGHLLEQGLRERVYRVEPRQGPRVRRLAERLWGLKASARDVVSIALSALRERAARAGPALVRGYTEENWTLTLELMGWLVEAYRRDRGAA